MTKVTVLDIQPIDPPVGGGRLRLLGLYGGFDQEMAVTYIGTYDWRGPKYRDHMLTDCLREINVPLSEEHFATHDRLSAQIGRSCIDAAFPLQGHLSETFINKAKEAAIDAQIVIFSHPWLFPFVAPVLDKDAQRIVYDSQNFEGFLQNQLLESRGAVADEIIKSVVRSEWALCHAADRIHACSEDDKCCYAGIYGVDPAKIFVVPNGVSTERLQPCDDIAHIASLKKRLGIIHQACCFMGSPYYPNEEAARLILETAKNMPQYQFVIIGGVGNGLKTTDTPPNVTITGFVEENEKIDYLHACDIAINPMLSGSGTNIKMFDFMAAGLPIITTDIGARGIANTNGILYTLCGSNAGALGEQIKELMNDTSRRKAMKAIGRKEVCEKYSWEKISYDLGNVLRNIR